MKKLYSFINDDLTRFEQNGLYTTEERESKERYREQIRLRDENARKIAKENIPVYVRFRNVITLALVAFVTVGSIAVTLLAGRGDEIISLSGDNSESIFTTSLDNTSSATNSVALNENSSLIPVEESSQISSNSTVTSDIIIGDTVEDDSQVSSNSTATRDIIIGDTVMFVGSYQYKASYPGSDAVSCTKGKAVVNAVNIGQPHPYHIIGAESACNAHGWVNADDITLLE